MALWPKLKTFFYNPITQLVVGLLAGYYFHRIEDSRVEPYFRVTPVEIAARKESPRLSVQWDQKPIENLCVSRIGLWNSGNMPLTGDKLPAIDPFHITATKPVRFLQVEVVNSSRPNLVIKHDITKDGTAVGLTLIGGDGLETNDGLAFRVLFTGDCSATLEVRGRILGVPSGFEKSVAVDRDRDPWNDKYSLVFLIPVWSFAVLLVYAIFSQQRMNVETFRDSDDVEWVKGLKLRVSALRYCLAGMVAFLLFLLKQLVTVLARRSPPAWLPF